MFKKIKSLLFENRDTRQTITKNVVWLSIGQFGGRLIRAFIVIYAARVMGAAEYGLFSYALGLAGFFTVFSDIGVGQIMTRESAKNPDQRSYYFSTAFWIKSILLALTTVVIIFIVPSFSNISGIETLLPFVALLVIFDGLRELALSFFRALEKMEWEAIVTLITNSVIAASGFVVLYHFATVRTFTMTYALSVGVGAAIAVFIIRQEFYKVFTHGRRDLVKPIISSAIPIAFLSALGAFMLNTDFVMLGWWQSPQAIGYYSAGQKIVQFLFMLPAIIASAVFPTLARLIGQQERDKIRSLMEKSVAIAFLMSLPIVIGGIVLAKPIIELIYGPEYAPAVANFGVLMITLLFNSLGVLIGNAAIAYNRQKQITKYLLASAIGNAIFDVILIPIYGIIGSSIATIMALAINIGFCWSLLKKINNFHVLPHLTKILLASAVMGAFSFMLNEFNISVIINIILSMIIYFGILYLLKEKSLEELKYIIRLAKS